MPEETYRKNRPFLLMEGGPLFQIEQRISSFRKKAALTKKRALLSILLTWAPLLILSLLQGTAYGRKIPVPFLRDFAVHARFVFAVSLLLLSENVLGPRIAEAAEQFVKSKVILPPDYAGFDQAVTRGLQKRDSITVEIVIAVLAFVVSVVGFLITAVHVSTWYAVWSSAGVSLTWAGWWLVCVSLPIYHFLGLRWGWRLLIWFQFLAAMNHLNLQLYPTHPDHAGGLGFVGEAQRFFGIVLFAFSCTLSGVIANEILYNGMRLTSFAPLVAFYLFLLLAALVLPLIIFAVRLLRLKRIGLQQYGTLGTAYTALFHRKWILGESTDDDALLGTRDIQSLADLGNGYNLVEGMRVLPIDPRTLIHLTIAGILPMVPLLLAVMPLQQLLRLLMKFLV